MRYYAAPMEGVTGRVYRCAHHRYFPGADRYYTPFLSVTGDFTLRNRELREVLPENNPGFTLVPQLLTNDAEAFLRAADALFSLGYGEVNLNLGCPSGTVTAKGKGCAMLAFPAALDAFLEAVFARVGGRVSVKARLGLKEAEEFPALLRILEAYPIAELILHPRTGREMYRGAVHLDAFERAAERTALPLCFNGNLFTPGDCAAFAAGHPDTGAVMLGRGLIADPALIRKCRGGPAATREELRSFLAELEEGYREEMGSQWHAAQRMKEVWSYLACLFEGGERPGRAVARARNVSEYRAAAAAILEWLPLRRDAEGVR